jgi:thiamine-phosphate pyrophosphorylase
VGPTFPSKTKEFTDFPGRDFIRWVAAETALPAFALGGINATNIADVVAAGARRVAVSSAVVESDEPGAVARSLRTALPD